MKVPYVVAVIHKDAVEQIPVTVPAHEVPILQAVHGDGRVTVDETTDLPQGLTETADLDPEQEFARLEQRYGEPPGTKVSYATMVYGSLPGFVQALEDVEGASGGRTRRKAAVKKLDKAAEGAQQD